MSTLDMFGLRGPHPLNKLKSLKVVQVKDDDEDDGCEGVM